MSFSVEARWQLFHNLSSSLNQRSFACTPDTNKHRKPNVVTNIFNSQLTSNQAHGHVCGLERPPFN